MTIIDNLQRRSWECNHCGSQEYTDALDEDDVHCLGCSECGGDEWHLAQERGSKTEPMVSHEELELESLRKDAARWQAFQHWIHLKEDGKLIANVEAWPSMPGDPHFTAREAAIEAYTQQHLKDVAKERK